MIDPLVIPRTIPELADQLRDVLGIEVSAATLYRMARLGTLATTDAGRKRSTIAAFLAATTPPVAA